LIWELLPPKEELARTLDFARENVAFTGKIWAPRRIFNELLIKHMWIQRRVCF